MDRREYYILHYKLLMLFIHSQKYVLNNVLSLHSQESKYSANARCASCGGLGICVHISWEKRTLGDSMMFACIKVRYMPSIYNRCLGP